MIQGIKLDYISDYTIKEDKKNPTIWKIGVMDSTTLLAMTDDSKGANFLVFLSKVVRIALKGWNNFKIDEKEVEYKTVKEILYGKERDVLDINILDCIPTNIIIELGTEILAQNKETEPERKN